MPLFGGNDDDGKPDPQPAYLTASAYGGRYSISPHRNIEVQSHQTAEWHKRAWYLYDHLAEVGFGARLTANTAALAEICPAKVQGCKVVPLTTAIDRQRIEAENIGVEPSGVPLDPTDTEVFALANECWQEIFGKSSQSYVLRLLVENLFVAGEVWLVETDPDPRAKYGVAATSDFIIVPSCDITYEGTEENPTVGYLDHRRRFVAFGDKTAIRFIYSHPKYPNQPTSSVQHIIEEGETLLLLRQLIDATASSAIHNGFMLIPDELSLAKDREKFQADIIKSVTEPAQDPNHPGAVAPGFLFGSAEYLAAIEHLEIERNFDEQLAPLMQRMESRVIRGLDLPQETLEGMGGTNHWCRPADTAKALTRDGWKTGFEVSPGEEILTYNTGTGKSEWQPVLDVYEEDVVDEPMLSYDRRGYRAIETPHHRCWVEGKRGPGRWVLSKDLGPDDMVLRRADHSDLPELPTVLDEVVELMGWYWTEGNKNTIAQSHTANPEKTERIEKVLWKLCGPETEGSLQGIQGLAWSKYIQQNDSSFGGPVTVFRMSKDLTELLSKRVPLEFIDQLTLEQLELFIEVSNLGDGRLRSGEKDTINVWQKNPSDLDALEYAAILAGRTVTRFAEGDGENLTISESKLARRARPGKAEEVLHTGTIWCPVTKNQTWFVQEGGTVSITGNSSWAINANYVRNHIQPILSIILDTFTRRVLHPKLESAGIEGWEDYCYWADVAQLATQPNKAKNAEAAHRNGVLSHAAYLREIGFSPTEDLANPVRTALGATGFGAPSGTDTNERRNGTNPDRVDEGESAQPSNGEDDNEA